MAGNRVIDREETIHLVVKVSGNVPVRIGHCGWIPHGIVGISSGCIGHVRIAHRGNTECSQIRVVGTGRNLSARRNDLRRHLSHAWVILGGASLIIKVCRRSRRRIARATKGCSYGTKALIIVVGITRTLIWVGCATGMSFIGCPSQRPIWIVAVLDIGAVRMCQPRQLGAHIIQKGGRIIGVTARGAAGLGHARNAPERIVLKARSWTSAGGMCGIEISRRTAARVIRIGFCCTVAESMSQYLTKIVVRESLAEIVADRALVIINGVTYGRDLHFGGRVAKEYLTGVPVVVLDPRKIVRVVCVAIIRIVGAGIAIPIVNPCCRRGGRDDVSWKWKNDTFDISG